MKEFDELHQEDNGSSKGESRHWMILVWTDNEEQMKVLDRLQETDIDYVGILHDKEKKPHYHIFLTYKNTKKKHQIAEKLNYDERWIRKRDRKKKAIQYLIHMNDPDKYQYDREGLFGPLTEEAIKICAKSAGECEAEDIKQILGFLQSYPYRITFEQIISKSIELDCYASFRRMGNLGVQLIKEHNELAVMNLEERR